MKLTTEELQKIQNPRPPTPEQQEEMRLEIERRIERDKDNPFFSSEWVGDTFVQKLVVNDVTVRQYLEDCIRFWRDSSAPCAACYIDAFQSAYSTIFCGGLSCVVKQNEEPIDGT